MEKDNCDLIQIASPNDEFPKTFYKFEKVYQFHFNDVECSEEDEVKCGAITDEQAERIMNILYESYRSCRNVIVHCSMGLCRSGAVVEAGVTIGFKDTGRLRLPNILVKKKILKYI
jgi:predicted protein tyrosine phosphatase